MAQRSTAWLLATFSALFAVGGAMIAYAEFAPLLRSGPTTEQKIAALTSNPLPAGLSYRSKMLVLMDCNIALSSIDGNVLPTEPRQALLGNCQSTAADILKTNPGFSFGWYIDALAAEGQGDDGRLSTALVQSQMTAPRPQWLSQSRAVLATRHASSLNAEAQAAYRRDLANLVGSNIGVRWLAANYRRDTAFQALITEVVEELPPAQQRRFISAVRSASQ